jgi:hypothetical protein
MAQEEAYLAALGGARKWVLDGYQLEFTGSGDKPVVRFEYVGPYEAGGAEEEGEDMINIGDMANPNVSPDAGGAYERMDQDSRGREFVATTDESGTLWFIVGTDSGFEGMTTLYYDTVTVVLEPK